MKIGSRITAFSLTHYKLVTGLIVAVTVAVLLVAAIPSLHLIGAAPNWVKAFSRSWSFAPTVSVDTDPENMLAEDEPVRALHHEMKKRMDLHDMVVVGVVNDEDPNGVFNPSSLAKIHRLTTFASERIQFDDQGRLLADAPAADRTPQASEEPAVEGLDGFEDDEPTGIVGLDITEEQAEADRPAEAPVGGRPYHGVIAGDVIAPSTVDAIEPRNGAIVFSWLMADPPQMQAEANEIRRKAQRVPLLDGTMVSEDGKAVAIYLPITSKDLSYGVYRALQDEIARMGDGPEQFHITGLPVAEDTFGVEMFKQMAVSAPAAMLVIFLLMLVFFRKLIVVISPMIVAMISVILTMGVLIIAGYPIHIMSSMIPIFIMPIAVLDSIHIISDFFEKYQKTRDRAKTMTAVMDELFAPMLYTSLTSAAGFASLALTPIPPVQVFGVFVATGVMFAWVLTVVFIPAFVMFISPKRLENFGVVHNADSDDEPAGWLGRAMQRVGGATFTGAKPIIGAAFVVLIIAGWGVSRININDNPVKWFAASHPIRVADRVLNEHFGGTYMAYLSLQYDGDDELEAFKNPALLAWQSELQDALASSGVVGKSSSLSDIVKTVHRDLLATGVDDPDIQSYYRLPGTPEAVAECLFQFESSHRPQDLAHFVTVNGDDAFRTSSLWVQLTSGDNQDMEKVIRAAQSFIDSHPAPIPVKANWFGLTYINVIWQDKMVVGMIEAFAGSFLVVFLLMTILFRSALWGLLSMIPLTVTIAAIYGAVGIVGKDYDMPTAVLSSLTLGLAVDFAIHFLARARAMRAKYGSWKAAAPRVFGEPARAISRNIIVIAAGFTPLLLAPLAPYKTVGVLLATILLASGVTTLLLLPALIRVMEKWLFRPEPEGVAASCKCGLFFVASITAMVLLALNLYSTFGFAPVTWGALIAIGMMALICTWLSRRAKCRIVEESKPPKES